MTRDLKRCWFFVAAAIVLACSNSSSLTTLSGDTAELTLVVLDAQSSSILTDTLRTQVGDQVELAAVAVNSLGQTVSNADTDWTVGDPAVATITSEGLLEAHSAGTTLITATADFAVTTVPVSVSDTTTDTSSDDDSPPPKPGLHPHEPDSMSVVFQTDGTADEFAEFFESQGWLTYVNVVDDLLNSVGSGKALEAVTIAGRNDPGLARADQFSAGAKHEWYLMYRIFYDANYENHGHKLFYLGMDIGARNNSGSATQMFLARQSDGRLTFTTQNAANRNVIQSAPGLVTFGEWHDIELHLVSESSPGAGDGQMSAWFDGTLVGHEEDVQWSASDDSAVGFDGMIWWQQSNDTNTRQDYFRVGELYISGRNDSTRVTLPPPDTTTSTPPPEPPESFSGYPNQPDSLSPILQADGTTNDVPELSESAGWLNYVNPIPESTNPAGTESVLEAVTEAGRNDAGLAVGQSFSVGPKKEWYIMYRILYDPNYENHGHKLFYLGMAEDARVNSSTATQMFLTRESDGRLQFLNQNGDVQLLVQSEADLWTFGEWHQVEIHLVAESQAGAGDGQVRLWFDGVLQGESTNARWSPASASDWRFDGMYLWQQSNNVNTRDDYYWIGEFYLSGR